MKRTKIILSILLATIFLATQIIVVGAAPATQDTTTISGTIDNIELEEDAETEITTVVVTLTVGEEIQTVRISLEDASDLGLVINADTDPVVDTSRFGSDLEINSAIVISDAPAEMTEEAQHPVGSALAGFFNDLLGVNYETIMEYHDEGVGFGLIAQALWMTNALEGDSEIFAAILEAQQSKDFSGITLPDGSTPQNWGQFRKAVLSDHEKAKANLGAIMSGRAADDQGNNGQVVPGNNGNGPDKDKDKNNNGNNDDKGNGKDKNKDKGKGKNK